MAIPFVTKDVARAIYEYAGSTQQGLPAFDDLAPTIQISYIEEAEAAINCITKHIKVLADQVPQQEMQPVIQGIMHALADTLETRG
jgi:hypothetical protein